MPTASGCAAFMIGRCPRVAPAQKATSGYGALGQASCKRDPPVVGCWGIRLSAPAPVFWVGND
jgi:hypothetical protein